MTSDDDRQPSLIDELKQVFGRSKKPVSGEQIKELVEDSQELQEDERRMIGEILSLEDLSAAEVMQPRVDIIAVQKDQSAREALERMRGTGYSRLPVFDEDLDNIVGIVHYKDLMAAVLDGSVDDPVTQYMNDALFVPETKDILPLLSELQEKRKQMAIVVDEYGGTDGLITVEDIVEEIVGEIVDESDSELPLITQTAPDTWIVDGRYPVEDALEAGWPVQDSEQYETIAGWLIDTANGVPKLGEEFIVDGYRFKVRSMRRRRIQALQVEKLAEADTSSTDEE